MASLTTTIFDSLCRVRETTGSMFLRKLLWQDENLICLSDRTEFEHVQPKIDDYIDYYKNKLYQ